MLGQSVERKKKKNMSLYDCFEAFLWASLVAQRLKRLPTMQIDPGSIPGWGRSPGEENGNALQYSCLENSMDGEAW